MNCYRHPPLPAVGICRACGKGLCSGCAADEPFGLACRDCCEGRVAAIGRVFAVSAGSARWSNSMIRSQAVFLVAFGVVFLGFAACCAT